ncbi:MAG: Ribosome-recycling factor [Candidatus Dependentiae bacterium ADurb.Bin331]|nr:MAG: Ribosome-recycling factor [Candidatus Dependentiae bacterium ADurb.Bin331]
MIELKLNDQNIKEFEKAIQTEMDKPIKHFERELITIRTGRAHPALVEDLKVVCYGNTTMRLRDTASISAPEARLIVIQPWDPAVLADIERALRESDLGISPQNDGALIRIVLPEISSARRDELVKILGKKLEDTRISIRNVRKDFHNLVRDSQKGKAVSEDHARRLSDLLQKLTDDFIKRAETMSAAKEKEIKSV